ncbi:MAG: DsbC family protein [Desulfuromonas thiophila]|nr:DsbC family protein [Desulfuromonas thiophila]
MFSRKNISAALAITLLIPSLALAQPQAQHKVDNMAQIGDLPFQMVESDGKTFFMSSNGRYVIQGEMTDMWANKKPIATVEDLVQSVNTVDFSAIGLDMEDLLHLKYGYGPEKVTIFVAPGCGYCKNALKQMKGLESKYTFQVVPLPIMGPRSEDALRRIACNYKDKPELSLAAVLSDHYDDLKISGDCDVEPVARALVTAQILGINSVPVIIDQKNRMSKGAPPSLAEHLAR